MNYVAFIEKKFCKIRTVLSGYARNQSFFFHSQHPFQELYLSTIAHNKRFEYLKYSLRDLWFMIIETA
jgi:hypothetical protein